MPLNPLVIETDYFKSIQNRKGLMKAGDFDFQFNNITNYINSSIVPLLNQLIANTTPGTQDPNKINTYLKNVGDGTTDWSNITFNEIPDVSLSFAKLAQANPCSILATGVDQIFTAITPTEDRQSLVSQNNNSPIWRKITASNIEDRQITGEKIALASLVQDNFQEGLIALKLTNNSVTSFKIANNTIPTEKIADHSINSEILGTLITNQFCGRNGSKAILWGNTLPNNIINYDQSLEQYCIDHTKIISSFEIPKNLYAQGHHRKAFSQHNLANQCIDGYQIKENSLNGFRLFWSLLNQGSGSNRIPQSSRNINSLLADGAIGIENLPASYKTKLGL